MVCSFDSPGSPQKSIPHLLRDQDDWQSRTAFIPAKLVPDLDRGAGIQGIGKQLDLVIGYKYPLFRLLFSLRFKRTISGNKLQNVAVLATKYRYPMKTGHY